MASRTRDWRSSINFGETQRKLNVLFERHARQQIKSLKNDADRVAAMAGELLRGHFGEVAVLREDGAGGRTVEAGDQI